MKRKLNLSAAAPRAELIASNAHSHWGAFADETPPAITPDTPTVPVADPDADSKVADQILEIGKAIQAVQATQKTDPDGDSDPNDKKVVQLLADLQASYEELVQAQDNDVAEDKPTPGKDPAAPADTDPAPTEGDPPASVTAAAPVSNVDVSDDVKCAGCQHLASAHGDTDGGANTGACTMQNCDCTGMKAPTSSSDDDKPVTAAGAVAGGSPSAPNMPAPAPAAAPEAPELNAPPAVEGGMNMGPAFTIPVAIIEGQPTSDGRQIQTGALDWRVPPLPLMGLATETHDPMGFDQNDPAVIIGRIDSLERVPGQGGTQVIQAKGFLLADDNGLYFADLIESMGRVGVSADVAVEEVDIAVEDVDPDGMSIEMSETLTKGTIMALTVCPMPAFEGAYIVLGDGTTQPETIPQATEPETVTASAPIHWMTYEQCEPCDQGDVEVIIAAGQGPVAPPRAWFANPNFQPGDGRLVEILDRRGRQPVGGKYACPLTITDEGQVYGHIAPWGICHTGHTGQCILAPKSKVDYAHFKRGQHVVTAEGDKIRVGVITCDTGHAPQHGVSATQAMAHYDNTALAAADVNIGDDEHGIWIAGAMRPDATPEQIRRLRAASISGDWRNMGGNLELVAALAVNQPGFPLAVVAAGQHDSLVAAGATVMASLKEETVPADDSPAAQALRAMRSREKLQRFTIQTRTRARNRVNALR